MSGRTSIEWSEATWNPIRARLKEDTRVELVQGGFKILPAGTWGYHCERVSPGCTNCYACTMNGRTLPAWGTGLDYTVPNREKVEIYLDEQELLKPLRWKKPRFIFPGSMTDLFADFVPDEFIDRMFAVMALCPQHTFQVLTKRAARLPEYMAAAYERLEDRYQTNVTGLRAAPIKGMRHAVELFREQSYDVPCPPMAWPLPVWLGVSVEDQQRADERIPHLLATPAALRWVSYEPALGPADFTAWTLCKTCFEGRSRHPFECNEVKLDWLVLGGESGPGARPCDLAWLRSAREQCAAAGVACFVKQLGARPFSGHSLHKQIHHRTTDGNLYLHLEDRKGGDPDEWPSDLRVREMPAIAAAGGLR